MLVNLEEILTNIPTTVRTHRFTRALEEIPKGAAALADSSYSCVAACADGAWCLFVCVRVRKKGEGEGCVLLFAAAWLLRFGRL